jgi:hypothetical protein
VKTTNIFDLPYALYTKPASNAVLGMIANDQSGSAIDKFLKDKKDKDDRVCPTKVIPLARAAAADVCGLIPSLVLSDSFGIPESPGI